MIEKKKKLLLGTYLKKTIIQKDTCIPMFTAALFTITRAWKQPIHREADKEDMIHMNSGILCVSVLSHPVVFNSMRLCRL